MSREHVITAQWLHKYATSGHGWTRRQIEALRIDYPPPRGWIRDLEGMTIPQAWAREFEALSRRGTEPVAGFPNEELRFGNKT